MFWMVGRRVVVNAVSGEPEEIAVAEMRVACGTPPPYTHKPHSPTPHPSVLLLLYVATYLRSSTHMIYGVLETMHAKVLGTLQLENANARTRSESWIRRAPPFYLEPKTYEISSHFLSSQLVPLKPLKVETFTWPQKEHVRPLALPPATNVPLCGAVSRNLGCGIYSKRYWGPQPNHKAIICGVRSFIVIL